MTISERSVEEIAELGYVDNALYSELSAQADLYGFIKITDANQAMAEELAADVLAYFGLLFSQDYYKEMLFFDTGAVHEEIPFSEVGLYASGEYELTYITESKTESMDEFLLHMTDNWLLDAELYQEVTDDTDGRLITRYGTSAETFRSYGPYNILKADDQQILLTRNKYWYGYAGRENAGKYITTDISCIIIPDGKDVESLFERGLVDILYSSDPYIPERVSPKIQLTDGTADLRTLSYVYHDAEWEQYLRARKGYIESAVTEN